MAKPLLKTVETNALRIELIQRGLTVEKLATDCGVRVATIRSQIARNFPSRRLRFVVEGALNTFIWSGQTEFRERRELASRWGFDPFPLSLPEIQQRLAALRVHGRSKHRRKSQLINFLKSSSPPSTTPTYP